MIGVVAVSSLPRQRMALPRRAGPSVQEYAAWMLDSPGCPTRADLLAMIETKVNAHGDADGVCANGCNICGLLEPFPCPARRFYQSVDEYLRSPADRQVVAP